MQDAQKLTVAEYVDLINGTLATIPAERIRVVGEIVEYRVSQGKWINFDLKDEEKDVKISCFATTFSVRIPLDAGMKVEVMGQAKVYERFGKFSLNVKTVQLVGEGALAKAYAMLKKKLADEGLFDDARKRSIPRFPAKIGLITSREAAAYGDFMRILTNRWSGVEVVHAHVHVQGQHAVSDILGAFERFNQLDEANRPDVLVLTRGGGSLEDLHAFNDEQIARAIFTSKIPVVVGVGHERDESLADFVADIRASTPSNAAERVVPDKDDIRRELDTSMRRMEDQLRFELTRRQRSIDRARMILERFISESVHQLRITIERFVYAFDRFRLSLIQTRAHIEAREKSLLARFDSVWQYAKAKTEALMRLFSSFDVQHTLRRGFAIVRSGSTIVTDPGAISDGADIRIQLAGGEIDAVTGRRTQEKLL